MATRKSIIQQMIEDAKTNPSLISLTIGSQTLLFKKLTDASSIYRIQRSAIKQLKVLKKIEKYRKMFDDMEDEIICHAIVFTELNMNEEKQTLDDFLTLAKEAGPVFTTLINGLDFMMRPSGEVEAEVIDDIVKN